MKKEIISTKVRFDKTELTKSVIYKIEDDDDVSIPPMFFSLKALKFYIVETIWDKWEELMSLYQALGRLLCWSQIAVMIIIA